MYKFDLRGVLKKSILLYTSIRMLSLKKAVYHESFFVREQWRSILPYNFLKLGSSGKLFYSILSVCTGEIK